MRPTPTHILALSFLHLIPNKPSLSQCDKSTFSESYESGARKSAKGQGETPHEFRSCLTLRSSGVSGEEGLDADEDKRAVRFWISLVLKERTAPSIESSIFSE